MCNLLVYRTQGLSPRPAEARGVTVREAACVVEEEEWLAAFPAPSAAPHAPGLNRRVDSPRPGPEEQAATHQVGQASPGRTLLLAEQGGQPAGYAELIPVQTLLYRGEWIETLVAPSRAARDALVEAAVNRAESADLDEVGAMVPEDNWLLQQALLSGGFRSFGEFHWLVAELPLPGWTAFPSPSLTSGDTSDSDHV
jgi:hypothetical protein